MTTSLVDGAAEDSSQRAGARETLEAPPDDGWLRATMTMLKPLGVRGRAAAARARRGHQKAMCAMSTTQMMP